MIVVKALWAFFVFGSMLAFVLAIVAGVVWLILAANAAYGFIGACVVYVLINLLKGLVLSAVLE
jgi:hypothetical protein